MIELLIVLFVGMLVGAYWLGWNDRELRAQEDDAFRRLDVLFERLAHKESGE